MVLTSSCTKYGCKQSEQCSWFTYKSALSVVLSKKSALYEPITESRILIKISCTAFSAFREVLLHSTVNAVLLQMSQTLLLHAARVHLSVDIEESSIPLDVQKPVLFAGIFITVSSTSLLCCT